MASANNNTNGGGRLESLKEETGITDSKMVVLATAAVVLATPAAVAAVVFPVAVEQMNSPRVAAVVALSTMRPFTVKNKREAGKTNPRADMRSINFGRVLRMPPKQSVKLQP
jgi:hypothetical protein